MTMTTGRTCFALAAVNDFIYAIGGLLDEIPLASVERYDLKGNVWESVSPMLLPRVSAAVAVLNGNIVVVGGSTKYRSCETKTVERFDGTNWAKVKRHM